MAFMLPARLQGAAKPSAIRPTMLPKPDRLDMLIVWIGVGADGIFVMTMTIMLARQASLEVAMISVGPLLAGRHFAGIVAAPLVGMIADRVGVWIPLVAMSALLIARFPDDRVALVRVRGGRHNCVSRRSGGIVSSRGGAFLDFGCHATVGAKSDVARCWRRGRSHRCRIADRNSDTPGDASGACRDMRRHFVIVNDIFNVTSE